MRRWAGGDDGVHALIQGIILGVLTAGVYALMSSGQTLIFGIMRVVNMAQGAMVILGAYLSYQLFTSLGVDPLLAIPVTTVVMFGVGVGVQLLFLRPLRADDRTQLSVLVTFAVALLVEGIMTVTWNTTDRTINTGYANASWTVFGYQITLVRLWAFLLSLAALGLLYLLLNRTRFGRAVRASVQNPESARLLGVESDRVAAFGYGLGTATAAAAGSVYGMLNSFNPGSHYDLISRLLSIVMLGGLGSIGGAVVGALVISVSSSVVAAAISPIWSQMTFFVVLLLVLLIRPRGLFGTTVRGAI
jgi:branched-chain amino acid transport system permease protein